DLDRGPVQERPRHLGDVVAAVAVLRPAGVIGRKPVGARLHGAGQVVDLHPGVVVIELAAHLPAVGVEHPGDAVADHAGAAVAHVQRAGGVGGHVFHARHAPAAAVVAAIAVALGVDQAQLLAPGTGGEAEIDEARAGDLRAGDQVAGR